MVARNDDPTPTSWSTEYHINRWKGGDQDSFEALYHHFERLLVIRVRNHRVWPVLEARHQVDDLVQAVWTRVVKDAPGSFESSGPGSFLAFLGSLTDHSLIDQARRDAAIKRGDGAQAEDLDIVVMGEVDAPQAIETPTSHARYLETKERIARELTEQERQVWNLHVRLGYTFAEVGLAMDRTEASIRGLFFRARRKLVRVLDDHEDDTPDEAPNGEDSSSP